MRLVVVRCYRGRLLRAVTGHRCLHRVSICLLHSLLRSMLTLIVVAESSPFRARVDTSLTKNAATGTTDGVAAAELFDQVWGLEMTTWLAQISTCRTVARRARKSCMRRRTDQDWHSLPESQRVVLGSAHNVVMRIPFSRQSGHMRVTLRSSRHSSSALEMLGASYTSPGLRTLPSGAYDMADVALRASFTVTGKVTV